MCEVLEERTMLKELIARALWCMRNPKFMLYEESAQLCLTSDWIVNCMCIESTRQSFARTSSYVRSKSSDSLCVSDAFSVTQTGHWFVYDLLGPKSIKLYTKYLYAFSGDCRNFGRSSFKSNHPCEPMDVRRTVHQPIHIWRRIHLRFPEWTLEKGWFGVDAHRMRLKLWHDKTRHKMRRWLCLLRREESSAQKGGM